MVAIRAILATRSSTLLPLQMWLCIHTYWGHSWLHTVEKSHVINNFSVNKKFTIKYRWIFPQLKGLHQTLKNHPSAIMTACIEAKCIDSSLHMLVWLCKERENCFISEGWIICHIEKSTKCNQCNFKIVAIKAILATRSSTLLPPLQTPIKCKQILRITPSVQNAWIHVHLKRELGYYQTHRNYPC